MVDDPDRFEERYGDKLWALLPVVYRADDEIDPAHPELSGPLEELVRRIGVQVAIVRRSIDRLWEDQSIETCDDWLIDYLGELVATNLVANLSAPERRRDVGKTIWYRRRKGTVAMLEQLANDVTGWRVRVVEMFRRLGRTRHCLDPAIGTPTAPPSPQQVHHGLIGLRSHTQAGGFADLRNVQAGRLTGTAFDEYFHSADARRGRGATGWYGIPRLGVFVWRLGSYPVESVTPVQDATCPNQYTFDPTGRDVPLFAAGAPDEPDSWVAAMEHQVPGPISRALLQAEFEQLVTNERVVDGVTIVDRNSLAVRYGNGLFIPQAQISRDPRRPTGLFAIDPERGRFIRPAAQTAPVDYTVDYRCGFSTEIGAGGYDRRPFRDVHGVPAPTAHASGGGAQLLTALNGVAASGEGVVEITDSRTYDQIRDLPVAGAVAIRAGERRRPVVRAAAATWTFQGTDPAATLHLDGLLVTRGTDVVLTGSFAKVRLSSCTFDPGSWVGGAWLNAADGIALAPSRLRIEGKVRSLEIDRCILGPIEDTQATFAEAIAVTDSIIQARPLNAAIALHSGDLSLRRSTVLGRIDALRVDASEAILHERAVVVDTQHGCVRFSAYAAGSMLPRQYESVEIAPRAEIFSAELFGEPAYAQLRTTADASIGEGAEDGSEMGAFSTTRSRIKERGIAIKFNEYLPIGLQPVIVHVT